MMSLTAVLSRLRLRSKLIAAMLAAGIVPLIVTGLLAERNARQALESQALLQLESVAAVKGKAIEDYFANIHHQAATLAKNPGMLLALESFTRDFARLEKAEGQGAPDNDAVSQALDRQYADVFAAEYHKQLGHSVDARSFEPTSRQARIAQYYYIADNPNALGQKDQLDVAEGTEAYHATHARYHPALRDFQARFGFYDLFLMDVEGNIVYTVFKELDFASNLKTGAWRDSALAEVYTAALASDQPGSTHIVDFAPYTPSYEASASFIAAPMFANGRKIGVVAMQMPVGRINDIMQTSTGLGNTGETYLIGGDSLMRSQSRIDKAPTLLAARVDTQAARAVLKGETGKARYIDRHGGVVYGAYVPLTLTGLDWALLAEVDESEIQAPAYALRWTMAMIALGATLAVAVFAWMFGSRLSARVEASVGLARRVAEGDFDNEIRIDTNDEIGDLLRALETMQTELFGRIVREKNEALRVGEALAVSTSNVMIADNDRNIVFLNRAVKEMFARIAPDLRKDLPAFDPSEILGRSIDLFHEDPGHQRRLLEGLASVHTAEIKVGGRILRIIATPVRNDAGERLGTVVEWTDLTEQRIAEQQIEQAIASAVAGKLDTRLDTQALDGFLRTVADGVNAMLDAIVQPLNLVAATLNQIAEGNIPLPVEAEFRGDFTAIKDNLNTCSKVLRSLLEDTSGLAEAAIAGRLDTRADLDRHWGDFRRIVEGMNDTLDAIAGPVGETREVMTELADGNLQRRIEGDYQGEFAVLRESVNTCASNLRDTVQKIRESARSIGASSEEISKGNQDLSSRTEEQASSLQQTAAAMEELTGTVKQNADNARQANQLAAGARDEAQQGGAVVAQAIAAMGQINESSKRIADIIGVIDEIAFQTNLLALNAAVEAARAGEHGRGFAVVASEVRNLAQRSAVAAKEIKVLIKDSVGKVEDGARLVNESGSTLTGIVAAVKKVSDIVGEIAAASAEQSVGIEQVNKAIMQMEQVTQQNAALVEQSAAASESMDDEARGLTKLMTFFQAEGAGTENPRDDIPRVERRASNRPWRQGVRAATREPEMKTPTASRALATASGDEVWDEF